MKSARADMWEKERDLKKDFPLQQRETCWCSLQSISAATKGREAKLNLKLTIVFFLPQGGSFHQSKTPGFKTSHSLGWKEDEV